MKRTIFALVIVLCCYACVSQYSTGPGKELNKVEWVIMVAAAGVAIWMTYSAGHDAGRVVGRTDGLGHGMPVEMANTLGLELRPLMTVNPSGCPRACTICIQPNQEYFILEGPAPQIQCATDDSVAGIGPVN